MATETLRPNAAGDLTEITSQYPSSGAHWEKVDEEAADEDTTYVQFTASEAEERQYATDLFNIPDPSLSGVIGRVTVFIRIKTQYPNAWSFPFVALKTHDTIYAYEKNSSQTWVTHSQELTTNPNTGLAWTWAEIDALQIGVKLAGGVEQWSRCTQVYVEVDYTDVIEKSSSDAGSGFEASSLGATLSRPDNGSGTEGTPTQAAVLAKSDSGSGFDALTSLLAALAKSETGSGADAYVKVVTIEQELSSSDVGAGIDALAALNIALVQSDAGTGSEALLSRLLHHADSGLGADACLTLLATLARAETGSGLDAFTGLITALAASETGLGVDKLLGRGISLFDAGSGLDAATLCKAFYSTDSGVGLEALATLLALITTSEIGSGSEKFRAKIMTSAGAYDMKLPTKMGQAEIPPKGVNS